MIDQIISMLEITESRHENIQTLKGKYELKLSLKEALEDINKYK